MLVFQKCVSLGKISLKLRVNNNWYIVIYVNKMCVKFIKNLERLCEV